ncbi:MAG: DEAD/DEAH box helicase family protein [Candidatus Aenigmarchaeota archaeon]|nr:DEAD/DEAH box helicase family protein [Candidatus Aenigmarchaeota archaeon]
MVELKTDVEPREYQKSIAETAKVENTLVVLPTGMGKTLISLLVAVDRLTKYPETKIMILSPTRPLSIQHKKTFENFTDIPNEEIVLLTGKINPEDRTTLYKNARIVIATPQTIENDLKNERVRLDNFSLIVFDESHRAVKDYAYTYVAKAFRIQSHHSLILGLTASPGASREKIRTICGNLFINKVEIRSEYDKDVERHVQPVEKEQIYVELPEKFKKIKVLMEEVLKDDLYWLKEHHYIPIYKPVKKLLLDAQRRIMARYTAGSKNFGAFWAAIRLASAIKVLHAIELLETQGVAFFYDFLKKLEGSRKKTDVRLTKDPRLRESMRLAEELNNEGVEHPKIGKIISIVKGLLEEKPESKIIIFANFRSTVNRLHKLLKENGTASEILIGQAIKEGKGLTQQQQEKILERFREGEFPVLLGTQVIEEGIDVPYINYAIFYETVPSEIRSIQRRGRVGRQAVGKVIFLITKGTRDEAYYYTALRKERAMKNTLYGMRGKQIKRKQNLLDWV